MTVEEKKLVYGQFYTKENAWLKKQVLDFIYTSNCDIAYDPFAGAGDLLSVAKKLGFNKTIGLDIDKTLNWQINDSLINIPHVDNAIIITNPPYLSNYSASRKKLKNELTKYFSLSKYDNLYLIALEKMLLAQENVVAIIPETFINAKFLLKNRLKSLTIIEDNLFNDTETPVVVACFDGRIKSLNEVLIYKNDKFIDSLGALEEKRIAPLNNCKMSFNDKNGWLGVRCVDSTDPVWKLRFDYKEKIDYNWEKGIKNSSRLLTLIQIDIPKNKRSIFIEECNKLLNQIREETQDIILSPFKGNMKNGIRRRRLDFFTCRAIIERAYYKVANLSCN